MKALQEGAIQYDLNFWFPVCGLNKEGLLDVSTHLYCDRVEWEKVERNFCGPEILGEYAILLYATAK